ncbi:hypothetical protein ACHHRT_10240 [Desulfurivibrio sp. D14AmB]|uniref:hypothetical protein n=1 Tax=Desulfurivibrio sp. D14AmB TaxID=3374370 RepID=UPI00376EE218
MLKGYPVLLVVRSVIQELSHLPDERRTEMITGLRRALAVGGVEAADSTADLLLFNYDNPLTAVTVLCEHLTKIRKKYGWGAKNSPLPLQLVVHLESRNEAAPSFRFINASAWDQLAPDKLYLSRALKLQWEKLLQGRQVPPHQMGEGAGEFTVLEFARPESLRRKRLFPHRTLLAAKGRENICFYCGLRDHHPSKCPAKRLNMATFSLPDVGYQPLPALVENFQAALVGRQELEALLTAGLELAQLRKNPPLQALVSFYDLLAVYQPRYLDHIAFTIHSVWPGLGKAQVKLENRNLRMGLDCLRVGQLERARNLLLAENQAMGGKQFCATIGLAFVALERGRFEEMGHHLQLAASLAEVEKEKIYSALLLARYHDLAGNLWKAEQALQAMVDLYVDCHEIVYRRIQTAVRRGQGVEETLRLSSGLAGASRLYFMNLLLDPSLLPIEGLLDDLLGNHLRRVETRAEEELAAATKEYERLGKWFDGEDEDYQKNFQVLERLQRQHQRRSYYDLADVSEKSRALRQGGPRLQEEKLDGLNEQIDQAVLEWDGLQTYWQDYPYKSFWRLAEKRLRATRRMLVEARGVAAESLRRGREKLATAEERLKEFVPLVKRMERLRLLLDSLGVFAGRLLVVELAVSALLLVLYPLVTLGLVDQLGEEIVRLVRDPVIQKRILFVANLLVAPLIAFGLTVRRLLP